MSQETNYDSVLESLTKGDKVRFLQDFYGVQYVEIVPRWQFWRRKKVQVSAADCTRLKAELKSRRKYS